MGQKQVSRFPLNPKFSGFSGLSGRSGLVPNWVDEKHIVWIQLTTTVAPTGFSAPQP